MDDDVWDEERWEAFLREHDARAERVMRHLTAFLDEHPAPPRDDTDAYAAWEERLRVHLSRIGWPGRTPSDDASADAPPGPDDAFDADALAGLLGVFADDERVPDDALLDDAERLADAAFAWAATLPDDPPESAVADLVAALLQVGAELAKAAAFGTEHDSVGGAIACTKRALRAANTALAALGDLRPGDADGSGAAPPDLDAAAHGGLTEALYELRNGVALRVLTLRERFQRGVD